MFFIVKFKLGYRRRNARKEHNTEKWRIDIFIVNTSG